MCTDLTKSLSVSLFPTPSLPKFARHAGLRTNHDTSHRKSTNNTLSHGDVGFAVSGSDFLGFCTDDRLSVSDLQSASKSTSDFLLNSIYTVGEGIHSQPY